MARRNKTFIFKRIVALCLTSVLVLAAGMSPVQASSVANQSTDGGSINNSQGKIGGDPHSKKNYNYTLAPGSNLYSEWNYKVFWPNDDVKFTTASNKQTDPTSGEEYSIVYEIKYENDKTSLKASDSAYNGPYYLKYKEVNDPPYEEGTNQ